MMDDYVLDKVLDKNKEIKGIDKFDNAKILSDTDDKQQNYITLKNVEILITCIITDGMKFYSQLFLDRALFVK